MNEEHDGTDQGNPSEQEYQRFRRMMDGMGREGLLGIVERLTERIEADPRDAEALPARGWRTPSWGSTALRRRTTAGSSPWTRNFECLPLNWRPYTVRC